MKRLPLLLFALFCLQITNSTIAQPVPSSCDGPSNLLAKYKSDAWQMTYRRLTEQNSPALNGVTLPEPVRDSILRAIFAVFNATSLPARDTVFNQFDIRTYKAIDLQRVEVLVDTTFGWTLQWLDYQSVTGNSWIDFLSVEYGLSVDTVVVLPDWVSYDAAVKLKTAQFVNPNFLAGLIANSTGVQLAHALEYGGDGDDIFFETKPDWIELTFRHGWTDCPTGCVFHRDWLFKIYPDCSVEFVAAYGDLLGTVIAAHEPAAAAIESNIYPIPASDMVFIQADNLAGSSLKIGLVNLAGQVVRTAEAPVFDRRFDGWLELDGLPDGCYFLTLTAENQTVTHQVLKRM